ncbi:MAG: hypothetical protein E7676_05115 [Ruminococcaceae bacterium]|nr:hypothetical protein [Oscillospiraceae bacterium]
MLRIVRSGFSSSGREKMYEEIKDIVSRAGKCILIVPEQQTVMTEGLMAKLLPSSSALVFEVTNFTRLANTTFRTLGGISGEYCDSAKKALIMWRALTELSPTLRVSAGRKEINAGLVESSMRAVAEMAGLGISPEELADSAALEEVMADERLSGKLSDLSKIYTLYKSLLSERYSDTSDDALAMIEKLSEHPNFLTDTKIFIEGFTSFTEPQYRLIGTLSARTDLTVSLAVSAAREGAFEYSEIRDTKDRLISLARRAGAEIKLSKEEGYGKKTKESLSEICDLLWTNSSNFDKISLQNSEDLRIFEAETPFDECTFACEDIKRRVMNGASYSDFAIVARNVDNYSGILDSALSRAKIPAFTSYRKDVSEFEAIKLIYTAYSASRGFSREDVITYAKCALSGLSREVCDELEMYVNKWQINGRRFTDEAVWNMNPLGYTTRRTVDNDEKLLRIHEARMSIISPLVSFAKAAERAKTVREHAEVLLDFLVKIDMETSLKKRSEALRAAGEAALADENERLWGVICDALDTLVEVLGDAPCDSEAFLSQLKVVFSATDIAKIPAYADEVTVGSADMIRLYEKPHVYLIGVNAGDFPATVSDNSYFSERDKLTLSRLGLNMKPQLEIKGARELYIFSRAFSYATESVTLSYSATDTRFKAKARAEVIDRITALSGGEVKPRKISTLPIIERLYTPEGALEDIGKLSDEYESVRAALVESGYEREVMISEGDITNASARLGESIVDGLYSKSLSLTQSRIDSYVGCPFAYFCRYTIGLSEDERAEFDAPSIGSFIHAILENFFRTLSLEGRKSGSLSSEEKVALTKAAAEKYISELGEDVFGASKRTKIKIDRLCRAALPVVDGLCEEFASSAYEPRFFELSLSAKDEASPGAINIKTERGDVHIYGIIDRVDAYKKGEDVYLRVIDYKTGHKEFSPDDMKEGANLQMFLYLKALVESENEKFRGALGASEKSRLIPGGVIYVKTSVGDVRVDTPSDEAADEAVKGAQEREGMILDDEDSISAMTLKYTPVYSKRTPDKIPDSKRKYLYTEDGWEEIMKTVEESVTDISDRIRSGEISAKPKVKKDKSPCEYCEFKAICRKVSI